MTTTATPLISRSPLHHWHTEHGARFTTSGGWQLPALYSSVERETAAGRSGLVLADTSAVAKIGLLGSGVSAAALALAGETLATKARGVVRLQSDPAVFVCRQTADYLLMLAGTSNPAPILDRLVGLPACPSLVRNDETTARAGFCLAGLHIYDVLRQLVALDVSQAALPAGSCAETGLAGVHALLVRPPELGGSFPPSLQIYVAWDLAEYVWQRLLDAGRAWGMAPLGWEALRALGLASF
jgi:glycine cleavage system aminomethyltransferase T